MGVTTPKNSYMANQDHEISLCQTTMRCTISMSLLGQGSEILLPNLLEIGVACFAPEWGK